MLRLNQFLHFARQFARAGGGDPLILNDSDRFLIKGLLKHHLHKIAPFSTTTGMPIEYTGADNEAFLPEIFQEFFACQLGDTIRIDGVGGIWFRIRSASGPIEYIVSAEMNQNGLYLSGRQCQVSNTIGVDFKSRHHLRLANVHFVESGGVNDHFGMVPSKFLLDLFESNDVEAAVCRGNKFVRL